MSNPFALEVHRPIAASGAVELPPLPPYVARAHDERLAEVVQRAADGASGMAVLVAGSSAGKTRACWEALRQLRGRPEEWRLWHPFDPTRPEAAVQALDQVGPRTVVWLNETQEYLGGEAGEQVAAKLRSLLAAPDRGPVLVLGTLWPDHHAALTERPGSQVRLVLDGTVIEVPEVFTGSDLAVLRQAAEADARLAQALQHAEDGQITQYLAGGPELVERFRAAPAAAKAVILAAMDARRMGHRNALPLALLEEAALAYLTDFQYEQLGEDWLEQALAYTSRPCKGARGPVTRFPPDRSGRGSRTAATGLQREGLVYRLADYLDQYGRTTRAEHIPPIGFWAAADAHAHPGDMNRLGNAAWKRGLYRDATQLHKTATTHGDISAAAALVTHLHTLHPADLRPAHHVAAHIALGNPRAVANLLKELREAGAVDQVTVLAKRAAAHTALGNPRAVANLLKELREAGAVDQVTVLAKRAAAHTALDSPDDVARLLSALRYRGTEDQVTALLARNPAAHTTIDDPGGVAFLLLTLRKVGARNQVTALLARNPAAHAALDNPGGVELLVRVLRDEGAWNQGTVLAERAARAAAHATLDNPRAMADPRAVANLLKELREAWVEDQVTALLARNPAAHTAIDSPRAVANLLYELREAGVVDQVTALLARNPAAHATIDSPLDVAFLLNELREAGAEEQATALLARNPAAHASLRDPFEVARLLGVLREAGAVDQVTVLAKRAAAHTALDNPDDVARLLGVLREAGAVDQVTVLAKRAAAHTALDNPAGVARLLSALRYRGTEDQVTALLARNPAAHTTIDDPGGVAFLLGVLREAGAVDQVTVLSERLPAAGMFELILDTAGRKERFRFGREPETGDAAERWAWADLA